MEKATGSRLITYTTGISAIFPTQVAEICSMSLSDPITDIPMVLLRGVGERTTVLREEPKRPDKRLKLGQRCERDWLGWRRIEAFGGPSTVGGHEQLRAGEGSGETRGAGGKKGR